MTMAAWESCEELLENIQSPEGLHDTFVQLTTRDSTASIVRAQESVNSNTSEDHLGQNETFRIRKLIRVHSNSSSSDSAPGSLSATRRRMQQVLAADTTMGSLHGYVALEDVEMPSFLSDSASNNSEALLVSLSPAAEGDQRESAVMVARMSDTLNSTGKCRYRQNGRPSSREFENFNSVTLVVNVTKNSRLLCCDKTEVHDTTAGAASMRPNTCSNNVPLNSNQTEKITTLDWLNKYSDAGPFGTVPTVTTAVSAAESTIVWSKNQSGLNNVDVSLLNEDLHTPFGVGCSNTTVDLVPTVLPSDFLQNNDSSILNLAALCSEGETSTKNVNITNTACDRPFHGARINEFLSPTVGDPRSPLFQSSLSDDVEVVLQQLQCSLAPVEPRQDHQSFLHIINTEAALADTQPPCGQEQGSLSFDLDMDPSQFDTPQQEEVQEMMRWLAETQQGNKSSSAAWGGAAATAQDLLATANLVNSGSVLEALEYSDDVFMDEGFKEEFPCQFPTFLKKNCGDKVVTQSSVTHENVTGAANCVIAAEATSTGRNTVSTDAVQRLIQNEKAISERQLLKDALTGQATKNVCGHETFEQPKIHDTTVELLHTVAVALVPEGVRPCNSSVSKRTTSPKRTAPCLNATYDQEEPAIAVHNSTFLPSVAVAIADTNIKCNATFERHCSDDKCLVRTSSEVNDGNQTFLAGAKCNSTFNYVENVKCNTTFDKPVPKNNCNITFNQGSNCNTTFSQGCKVNSLFGQCTNANTTFDRVVNGTTTCDQSVTTSPRTKTKITFDNHVPRVGPNLNATCAFNDTFDAPSQPTSPIHGARCSPSNDSGMRNLHRDPSFSPQSFSRNNRSLSEPSLSPPDDQLHRSVHQLCQSQSYSCINLMDADMPVLKHILRMDPQEQQELRMLFDTPAKQCVFKLKQRRSLPSNLTTLGTPNRRPTGGLSPLADSPCSSQGARGTSAELAVGACNNITTSTPKPAKTVQEILSLYKQNNSQGGRNGDGDDNSGGEPVVERKKPKDILQMLNRYKPLAAPLQQDPERDKQQQAPVTGGAAGMGSGRLRRSRAISTPNGEVVAAKVPLRAFPGYCQKPSIGTPINEGCSATAEDDSPGCGVAGLATSSGNSAAAPGAGRTAAAGGGGGVVPVMPSFGSISSIGSEQPCSPELCSGGSNFAADSPIVRESVLGSCRTSTPAGRGGGAPLQAAPTPVSHLLHRNHHFFNSIPDASTCLGSGGAKRTTSILQQQQLPTPPLQQIAERIEEASSVREIEVSGSSIPVVTFSNAVAAEMCEGLTSIPTSHTPYDPPSTSCCMNEVDGDVLRVASTSVLRCGGEELPYATLDVNGVKTQRDDVSPECNAQQVQKDPHDESNINSHEESHILECGVDNDNGVLNDSRMIITATVEGTPLAMDGSRRINVTATVKEALVPAKSVVSGMQSDTADGSNSLKETTDGNNSLRKTTDGSNSLKETTDGSNSLREMQYHEVHERAGTEFREVKEESLVDNKNDKANKNGDLIVNEMQNASLSNILQNVDDRERNSSSQRFALNRSFIVTLCSDTNIPAEGPNAAVDCDDRSTQFSVVATSKPTSPVTSINKSFIIAGTPSPLSGIPQITFTPKPRVAKDLSCSATPSRIPSPVASKLTLPGSTDHITKTAFSVDTRTDGGARVTCLPSVYTQGKSVLNTSCVSRIKPVSNSPAVVKAKSVSPRVKTTCDNRNITNAVIGKNELTNSKGIITGTAKTASYRSTANLRNPSVISKVQGPVGKAYGIYKVIAPAAIKQSLTQASAATVSVQPISQSKSTKPLTAAPQQLSGKMTSRLKANTVINPVPSAMVSSEGAAKCRTETRMSFAVKKSPCGGASVVRSKALPVLKASVSVLTSGVPPAKGLRQPVKMSSVSALAPLAVGQVTVKSTVTGALSNTPDVLLESARSNTSAGGTQTTISEINISKTDTLVANAVYPSVPNPLETLSVRVKLPMKQSMMPSLNTNQPGNIKSKLPQASSFTGVRRSMLPTVNYCSGKLKKEGNVPAAVPVPSTKLGVHSANRRDFLTERNDPIENTDVKPRNSIPVSVAGKENNPPFRTSEACNSGKGSSQVSPVAVSTQKRCINSRVVKGAAASCLPQPSGIKFPGQGRSCLQLPSAGRSARVPLAKLSTAVVRK